MKRPQGVTLLALLDFSKAGLMLLLAAVLLVRPDALADAGSVVLLLISIAKNSPVHDSTSLGGWPTAIEFSLYALFDVVLGYGLWSLKKWARWYLVVACGAWMARWITGVGLRDWAGGRHEILPDNTYSVLAGINAVILLCLFTLDVKRAFGGTES